jgi:oligopeptide transport system permease protein
VYFLRRIAWSIPLLLVISLLGFLLLHAMPGGPFDRERAPASEEIKRQIEAKYHVDEPVWKQYGRYLRDLIHGDLGPSYQYRNHSVNDIIREALPVSMVLGALAFGFAMGVGVPLGLFTALRRGHWESYAGSFFALLTVCVPGLVIAPLLIMVFAIKWRLFPVALWSSPLHVVLPTIALGLFFSGKIARLMHEGMIQAMQSEFITAARAKGMTELNLMLRHALRLAILPVVSYSGPLLADLLTGSFVIESVFQIPGIGAYFVTSFLNHDGPLTVGLMLVYAVLLIGLNLLVDFGYALLDPRVKYE